MKNFNFLVIGSSTSAIPIINQLKKLNELKITWASTTAANNDPDVSGVEKVFIKHPYMPETIKQLTRRYKPQLIILCPGGNPLNKLAEGNILEQLLLEELAIFSKIPVLIASQKHSG
jgi:hypothetical protein